MSRPDPEGRRPQTRRQSASRSTSGRYEPELRQSRSSSQSRRARRAAPDGGRQRVPTTQTFSQPTEPGGAQDRRRVMLFGGLIGLIAVIAVISFVWWRSSDAGPTRPDVVFAGIDIPGGPPEDAAAAIQSLADLVASRPVMITSTESDLELDPADIGLRVDREATYASIDTLENADTFKPVIRYDDAALASALDNWAGELNSGARQPELIVEGAAVRVDEGEASLLVDVGRLQSDVERTLDNGTWLDGPVTVEVTRGAVDLTPLRNAASEIDGFLAQPVVLKIGDETREISQDQLASSLNIKTTLPDPGYSVDKEALGNALDDSVAGLAKDPVDARLRFEGATPVVVAPEDGLSLDLAGIVDKISNGERTIEIPTETLKPERGVEWAEEQKRIIGDAQLISTFTTNHPAGQSRVTNIHRIADIVDGTIVMPGEQFSLNATAGQRTTERGFVEAGVIYQGEFTDDIGGGVSQFATTMFNAAFFGAMQLDEWQAHSYWISRYPKGREATVSWTKPDLRWTNTSGGPVIVKTSYTGDSITVSLLGHKAFEAVHASDPKTLEYLAPRYKYEPDPNVPVGQQVVESTGTPGEKVEVFRTIVWGGGRADESMRILTTYRSEFTVIRVNPASVGSPPPPPAPPATPAIGEPPAPETTVPPETAPPETTPPVPVPPTTVAVAPPPEPIPAG